MSELTPVVSNVAAYLTQSAVDKPDGAPASFDDAIARYRFERVQE